MAAGLGTVGDPRSTAVLTGLAKDTEALVRAAAFEAAGELGCPAPLATQAVLALDDPAWQVRKGAAQALATAPHHPALDALIAASHDPHLDVRKALSASTPSWSPVTKAR